MANTTDSDIPSELKRLQSISPAGYAVALHVRFTTPTYLFQTYPREWLDYYSQNGLVMSDPTVHWGFENTGVVRWSALAENDSAGVIIKAAEYGMRYGVAAAIEMDESRSIASFTRNDREFTDDEMQQVAQALTHLHQATSVIEALSSQTTESLRKMSVQFTHPE